MIEITCKCGKNRRTFIHLSLDDFPEGLELPCCKEKKAEELEKKLAEVEKRASEAEKKASSASAPPKEKKSKKNKKQASVQ